VISPEDSER